MANTSFGRLAIIYDDGVLAPRPWTVLQAEWAAEVSTRLADGPILELCTGAGHIGLLAASLTDRALVQVEADPAAAEYAQRNAASAGLTRVDVRNATLESAMRPDERFALILADPPYVPTGEVNMFPDDPTTAIDGGVDGLVVVRRVSHRRRHAPRRGRGDAPSATRPRAGRRGCRPPALQPARRDRSAFPAP